MRTKINWFCLFFWSGYGLLLAGVIYWIIS